MTTDEPLSQFHLRLAAPEGDLSELDDLTWKLRNEVAEADVERVDFVPAGDVPEGAKAGLVTAHGELNVTLRPAALPSFLSVVRDWLSRQNQRVEIVATVGSSTFHINASITDVSTIMQALGSISPGQGAPERAGDSVINQSGGADLNAEQISIGGDITGRDKIIQIHAEAGATVYLGGVAVPPQQPFEDDRSP
jgi:hypothetical protein